jgi:hypothetical protein
MPRLQTGEVYSAEPLTSVTTGLDPVVHADSPRKRSCRMDCRIKSGNDDSQGRCGGYLRMTGTCLLECLSE